jgi:hypothetical protein
MRSGITIEKKDYQGIPYVSGGVGVDEREAFVAMGKDYSLKLMFAIKSGEYLSDVKVEISDSIGKKLQTAPGFSLSSHQGNTQSP